LWGNPGEQQKFSTIMRILSVPFSQPFPFWSNPFRPRTPASESLFLQKLQGRDNFLLTSIPHFHLFGNALKFLPFLAQACVCVCVCVCSGIGNAVINILKRRQIQDVFREQTFNTLAPKNVFHFPSSNIVVWGGRRTEILFIKRLLHTKWIELYLPTLPNKS
jgi:hypothetical protein